MDSWDLPDLSSDDAGTSLVPSATPDLFCDPCLEERNHIQAEGYCVDCEHHLCGICFLHHCKPKPWRDHQLMDKKRMPKSKSDKVYKDECTDKCTTHGEEILRYFCEDHKLFGCTVCVTLDHRTCNVGYIPTLSGDLFDCREYTEFKHALESLVRTTRSLQDTVTNNLEKVGRHAERAIEKIRKLRKEIETFFDDIEHDMSDRVTKIQHEDQNKIQAISNQCNVLAGTIKDLKTDIEDKEKKNQKCRLFVDVKELQDTLKQHKNDISEMEKANIIREFTFKPSEEILNLTSDRSVQLGSLVDFCQAISAIIPSEDRCIITDIAVLPDGKIAVIDVKHDCIKVIDTTCDRVITSVGLSKCSRYSTGIATVSENEIAVSYNGEIKLYSVTDQIKLTKTIRTPVRGSSLVYTNNMFIGVKPSAPPTLCMVNMNGDVVKTFPTQKDGETLFKDPDYIAVTPDQTAIYVSDWGNKTVTCLTFDGEVKSRYTYGHEWSPQGVAVSRDGLVYVCDSRNDSIHILTTDLEEVDQIVGEQYSMRGPQGLGYCVREQKLYVRMWIDSTIRVFNI